AMHYPCNYGYVPQTLAKDGGAVDVLVLTPFPVAVGTVIECRPLGILEMEDEGGIDAKILAVPATKLYQPYRHLNSPQDLPQEDLDRLKHFIESYKELEPGKWVKVQEWKDAETAKQEILNSIEPYQKG